jgi:hypothetical protein
MYRQNNQQNLNEHGGSHHRSNTHIGLGFFGGHSLKEVRKQRFQ